jgi:hypothetical protein
VRQFSCEISLRGGWDTVQFEPGLYQHQNAYWLKGMIYAKLFGMARGFRIPSNGTRNYEASGLVNRPRITSRTNADNDNPIMTGDLSPRPAPTYLIDTAPSFSGICSSRTRPTHPRSRRASISSTTCEPGLARADITGVATRCVPATPAMNCVLPGSQPGRVDGYAVYWACA